MHRIVHVAAWVAAAAVVVLWLVAGALWVSLSGCATGSGQIAEHAGVGAADCLAATSLTCAAAAVTTCPAPSVLSTPSAWSGYAECLGTVGGECAAGQAVSCVVSVAISAGGTLLAQGGELGTAQGALVGSMVDPGAVRTCVQAQCSVLGGPDDSAARICHAAVRSCIRDALPAQ